MKRREAVLSDDGRPPWRGEKYGQRSDRDGGRDAMARAAECEPEQRDARSAERRRAEVAEYGERRQNGRRRDEPPRLGRVEQVCLPQREDGEQHAERAGQPATHDHPEKRARKNGEREG